MTDQEEASLFKIDEEGRVQIFAGNKVEGNQDFPVKVRFSPLHVTSSKRIRILKKEKKAIISLFFKSCNVCPMAIPEICAQTKGIYFCHLFNVVWQT